MPDETDPNRVLIFDTTLRDGEQAPGSRMNVPDKLEMARALDALGVDIIEAGFPIASPADSEAVRRSRTEVRRPTICGAGPLPRRRTSTRPRGRCGPPERPRIHTFLATSDLHLQHQAAHDARGRASSRPSRRPPRQAVHRRCRVLGEGRDAQRPRFSVPGGRGGDRGGRTTVNLPDTVGYATPDETRSSSPTSRSACPTSTATLQRALPRRSRPRRRQQPRRDRRAACGRSSARSTASASARATPRSKRS